MLPNIKKHFSVFHRARDWYARFERPISSLSLLGGFIFNIFALTRVDEFKENFWIGIHILVAAACIILLNREENNTDNASANPAKLHFWLITILQFMFGGLLSTYLVFYFRGAVLSVAWPFLLILIIAFIANESLKRHYARLYFQISFFFLSIFLFAIYVVPVISGSIGPGMFVISGISSLILIWIFLSVLRYFGHESLGRNRVVLFGLIASIFIGMNVLYFLNLIPPLPLSLHDAGVYHSVVRTADGNYSVTGEHEEWWHRFTHSVGVYSTYHAEIGQPAYVFTAIFSPAAFNLSIIHQWQWFDPTHKEWVTMGTIPLPVKGGREGGYRTYSALSSVKSGKWRVTVRTQSGQVIGRLVFNVVIDQELPQLETIAKK
jgi:hypothetical protein